MKNKFANVMEDLKNRKIITSSLPTCIFIESVKGCSYKCAMCDEQNTKPNLISKELLNKIEPYYKNLEVLTIHGSGEPLLADLPYFAKQATENDFVIHMNSTGFYLTEKKIDILLKNRLAIIFSVHAGTAKTYKKIMGHDLHHVVENVKLLIQKSKASGLDHDFWFAFMVVRENIDEVEDFLYLAKDCGIKSVRFMKLIPHRAIVKGREFPERDFTFNYFEQSKNVREKFLAKLPTYRKLAQELGIRIEPGSMTHENTESTPLKETVNLIARKFIPQKTIFPLTKRKGICLAPWIGQLTIAQDGNVGLCCSALYSLGNINNSSIEEIWNSQQMQKIRASFNKGDFPSVCGYCKSVTFAEYPHNSFTEVRKRNAY